MNEIKLKERDKKRMKEKVGAKVKTRRSVRVAEDVEEKKRLKCGFGC
jgi:hypothetical protein